MKALTILREGVGGHGQDGNVCQALVFQSADGARGLVAVHDRHLHVHEHQLEMVGAGCLQQIHCLLAVHGILHREALVFQKRDGYLAVQVVVVHKQQMAAAHGMGAGAGGPFGLGPRRLRASCVQGEQQLNGECRAAVLFAFHGNRAVHHVHQVLRDRHAQARALDAADGARALALEGVEDVIHELGGHADARIGHGEAVAAAAGRRSGQLVDGYADEPARIREFQRIAQQVQQDLVDAQLVAAHVGVGNAPGVDGQIQLACARLGLDDAVEVVQQGDEAARLLVERYLAAFDAAAGQGGEAHDGVHGRADVVGHVREEGAFGGVGLVRRLQGLFQKRPLLHLVARLRINAAEAEHDIVALLPIAGAHGRGLAVLHLGVANDTVVHVGARGLGQHFAQVVGGQRLAHGGAIVLVHGALQVGSNAGFQLQGPGEQLVEVAHLVAAHAQRHALAGIQVERAHDEVVLRERVDELFLVALLLHLLQLPVGVIQKEALEQKLPVALDELHVAEHVQDVAVLVAHAVLGGHRVADVFQQGDACAQSLGVFGQHRGGYHIEAVLHEALLGFVAENSQGGLVHADQAAAVEGMGDHAAFHGGEDGLQGAVLLDDLVLEGALLGDVDAHPHGAHNGAVDVVQGRLVGGEQADAVAGLHRLLRDDGGLAFHHLALRLDAGRIVGLDIPDIGMAAALHVVFGLVHRGAEGVVDLVVDTVFRLVPHQARDGVDGGLQILVVAPGVGIALAAIEPALETIGELAGGKRRHPDVVDAVEQRRQLVDLLAGGDDDDAGPRLLRFQGLADPGERIMAGHVHE